MSDIEYQRALLCKSLTEWRDAGQPVECLVDYIEAFTMAVMMEMEAIRPTPQTIPRQLACGCFSLCNKSNLQANQYCQHDRHEAGLAQESGS